MLQLHKIVYEHRQGTQTKLSRVLGLWGLLMTLLLHKRAKKIIKVQNSHLPYIIYS